MRLCVGPEGCHRRHGDDWLWLGGSLCRAWVHGHRLRALDTVGGQVPRLFARRVAQSGRTRSRNRSRWVARGGVCDGPCRVRARRRLRAGVGRRRAPLEAEHHRPDRRARAADHTHRELQLVHPALLGEGARKAAPRAHRHRAPDTAAVGQLCGGAWQLSGAHAVARHLPRHRTRRHGHDHDAPRDARPRAQLLPRGDPLRVDRAAQERRHLHQGARHGARAHVAAAPRGRRHFGGARRRGRQWRARRDGRALR
mmetsp:Transcript_41165/g.96160  ORF Transcript_41165/g.96160 Transcript_41165/m.96160 type:complete len:254 (+) Transcript_41165:396-1157(+)